MPWLHATRVPRVGTGIGGIAACLMTTALLMGVIAGCGADQHPPHRPRSPRRPQIPAAWLTTTAVTAAVDSVPFAPASSAVHADCAETARTVGYLVPCPTLLPLGMEATEPVHGCRFRIVAPVGWAGCRGVAPNGWFFGSGDVAGRGGGNPGFQHLVLFAAPRVVRNPARAIDGPTVFPERVQRRGVVDVDGVRMTFYMVPMDNPSAFRGHLVLLWDEHGHTYVYGFHVTATIPAARALDLELVLHLTPVAP
jgi:hypothetical protein